MQEAEEQDTCRICSAPAEVEQPLFYPCKCSGTIRYIHQDCLTTWLAHSKKKTCDVCKHPYTFTKVYAPDMPTRLPPVLLLRRVAQQSFFAIIFAVRAVAVATIWLAVLPWVTVMSWRLFFYVGDYIAWRVSDRPRPTEGSCPFHFLFRSDATGVPPPPDTLIARVAIHPLFLSLSSDIFTGQIIASLVVLTFVAVFLLREWISQNARPGVFEDEDPDIIQAPPLPPLEAPPALPPPAHVVNERIAQVQRQIDVRQRQIDAVRAMDALRVSEGDSNRPNRNLKRRLSRRGKDHEEGDVTGSSNSRSRTSSGSQRRPRRDDNDVGRRFAGRYPGSRHRPGLAIPERPPGETDNFEFTFRSSPRLPQDPGIFKRRSFSEPPARAKFAPTFEADRPGASLATSRVATPVLRTAAPEQPSRTIPFALFKRNDDIRDESFVGNSDVEKDLISFDDDVSTPSLQVASEDSQQTEGTSGRQRRPPLPNSTPTLIDEDLIPMPLSSPSSPQLATYHAPEELEIQAGPSRFVGYFDRDEIPSSSEYKGKGKAVQDEEDESEEGREMEREMDAEEMEREHAQYFADAEDDDEMPKLQSVSDSDEDDDGSPRNNDFGNDEDEDGDFYEDVDEDGGDGEDDDGEDEAPIWQAIQIEDDEVAEVGDGEMEAGVAGDAAAPVAPAPAGAVDAAAVADIDEMEGNVEDDMEGAMEAIGMRGPVLGIVQNAALMMFVLDTAIGLLVWLPFTLGKSTALLSLDPQRFLQIIHLPIRAMRIITDPIVDSVMYIVTALMIPLIIRFLRKILDILMTWSLFLIAVVLGKHRADKAFEMTSSVYSRVYDFSDKPFEQFLRWTSLSSPTAELDAEAPAPSAFHSVIVDAAEPYFAAIGQEVRLGTGQLRLTWTQLALGHGPKELVFAVALGYIVVMVLISLYLNLLTVGNMKTAGRAVRTAVREQLLVLKVATFIFIELVTFPLGCGLVLDLCTVWFFPEASPTSRIVFFQQAPLTAMFYHWIAGTMFMYSLAVLLSGCRTLLRKGAMWFVKDPQDQNQHPIRDILDRGTLTQLRKICVSAIMYSIVVACVVGSVAGLLFIGSKSILPFRWKNREPLSNVPVDLIFLHLVLPYTMHYFRPRTGVKKVSKALWMILASKLRLSSYFFGGRYHQEEYTPNHWWSNFIRPELDFDALTSLRDGTFRRVPATDDISLPRDMHATASVTEDGDPTDEEAQKLIAMQNEEALKAKRVVNDDYEVVYIPPNFRQRVFMFIAVLWVLGAIFLGVMFALPIQLGRSFFGVFTAQHVHDGYSFLAGLYLLWACYLIGRAVDRLDKRRQRRGGDEPRADLRLLVIKRGLLWTAKIAYMIIFLGIVAPTLISLVVDLYIVFPIRLSLDPTLVPRIRIVDSWAMGLLYAKIVMHIHRTQPPNAITRGIQHITNNGWTHPEPITATKEVIAPLTIGLLGMILLPGGVFLLAQRFIPLIPRNSKLLFMEVYPAIFVIVAGVRFGVVLIEVLGTWSQAIRDKEFLVEMRLRNLEPESTKTKATTTDTTD